MKTIFFIVLSAIINIEAFSQESNFRNETADFITSVMLIRDLNPTEQKESDSINKLFISSLNHYLERKGSEVQVINKAFQFLYRNGSSEYSDSPEERSMKSRRALCFASIALQSESENVLTFIDYSYFSIMGGTESPNIDLLEERLLGLLWLEMLIKVDEKSLTKTELQKIQDFISLQSHNLTPYVIDKTNHLINTYLTNIK